MAVEHKTTPNTTSKHQNNQKLRLPIHRSEENGKKKGRARTHTKVDIAILLVNLLTSTFETTIITIGARRIEIDKTFPLVEHAERNLYLFIETY